MKLDPNKCSSTSPPRKRRAFHGLAGSPLAQFRRELQSLQSHPIAFNPAALHDGRTVDLPPLDRKALRKLAAAVRAEKWRTKHVTPAFKAARAKSVRQRRANTKDQTQRIMQIEAIVKANPVPLFVMKDAPHGKGLLVTGGNDFEALEEMVQGQDNTKSHMGYGSESVVDEDDKEFDDTFVELKFLQYPTPKDVKLLHQFVYESTIKQKNRALRCLKCKAEVSPSLSSQQDIELTYVHVFQHHPDVFQTWLTRLNTKGGGCREDHSGMVERYATGTLPLVCGRCGKVLWKPPKLRTHTAT
jgi:hypothetical protein